MRLALLYGGRSGEHEVSCRSAASILRNLDSRRYDVVPIAIDHDGVWYLQNGLDPARIGDALEVSTSGPRVAVLPGSGFSVEGRPLEIEVAFPILHGSFGEDGTVQGLLEMTGIAYVGSGVLASAAGMDKETMKRLWREAGLPTAPFVTFFDDIDLGGIEARIEAAGLSIDDELFVKPARGGSSVGISKVQGRTALEEALRTAFRYDTKAIVEQRIVGREIECAVIGDREVETFPPGEIVPRGSFYDYDAKYVDPDGAELVVPADLPPATLRRIREAAAEAYRTLEAEGYARVDLFVTEEGNIFLNEINTIPGFTTISMFPRMCQGGGLTYATLLDRLIDLGLERHRQRERLEYRYG
ncbi:MAG: D-alanine--D-alanine ligase family protein [Spirochaetaceae bacterium]